jgi:methyl-accepting chemotaxis protein
MKKNKSFKSLKFQFIMFFSVFLITLILVTTMLGMRQLSRVVEKAIEIQGIYILERAVTLLDDDSFEALSKSLDVDDPYYKETRLKILNLIKTARMQKLLVGGVSIVFGILLLILFLNLIFPRIKNINNFLKELSSGEGDLTRQIKIEKEDEIGEMSAYFNLTIDKLNSAFSSFSQNASKISNAVYDLSASAKEITTTANEQSASVAEIVSTMENNKNLSGQVASKTIEVAELAAKTKEMSQHGADLHDANEEMMADIRDQNVKIVEEIRNLNDVLSGIGESVQLIDTIADKTKLIAFNAALEASSSGEAGLRFAVVASEIRRFADNVVESVLEIKDRISELQNAAQTLISEADTGSKAIDSGYNRMVEQKEVFINIVDVSQNVAVRSEQISNLSKQQELASAQIFTALKEISAGVKQFVAATASTSATADNLNGMSIQLKETIAQYRINV